LILLRFSLSREVERAPLLPSIKVGVSFIAIPFFKNLLFDDQLTAMSLYKTYDLSTLIFTLENLFNINLSMGLYHWFTRAYKQSQITSIRAYKPLFTSDISPCCE
jgi:hypothetical protein